MVVAWAWQYGLRPVGFGQPMNGPVGGGSYNYQDFPRELARPADRFPVTRGSTQVITVAFTTVACPCPGGHPHMAFGWVVRRNSELLALTQQFRRLHDIACYENAGRGVNPSATVPRKIWRGGLVI